MSTLLWLPSTKVSHRAHHTASFRTNRSVSQYVKIWGKMTKHADVSAWWPYIRARRKMAVVSFIYKSWQVIGFKDHMVINLPEAPYISLLDNITMA